MATKLTATLHGYYRKNGRVIYRFLVNGDKDSLAAYELAQGTNLRTYENPEDSNDKLTGTPLYFSPRPIGKTVQLDITANGKVVVAEDIASVMDKDLNYADKVETALATKEADILFKRKFHGLTNTPAASQ